MDAQVFWSVISNYNQQTKIVQACVFAFVILAVMLSYTQKIKWAAKFALGIVNLFIGFVFYIPYGIEPIQKYFALPLYLVCGVLFLYESYHSRDDCLKKPNFWQMTLLLLYLLYPLVSVMLGGHFPQMVTHIMPCPVVSLSIVVYSCYARRNKILLALLTIWGLTGIKSVFFNVYEDTILLICGIYGIVLLIGEIKQSYHCYTQRKKNKSV